MIRIKLTHVTSYDYDRPVQLSPQVVRLRPAPHSRTPVTAYSMQVANDGPTRGEALCFTNWLQDPFGNWQARLVFHKPTTRLAISIDLVAELSVINPFDFFLEPECESWPFTYPEELARDLAPCLQPSPQCGRLVTAWIAAWKEDQKATPLPAGTARRTIDVLVDLNQRLSQTIDYRIRMEPGIQTPEETLVLASGSCRDSSWLLVNIMRRLGLAARFASGYLVQLRPDQRSLDGPSGPEEDVIDLHAWCEVYAPGAGWIGLDPTSGLICGEGHIPLACTPEPTSAAPISGGFAPVEAPRDSADEVTSTMAVSMSVVRIYEEPRQHFPYRPQQWEAIVASGRAVDARLRADDVRLTMGGEPTFVGIDNPDLPEWSVDALGPAKRARAGELVRRLWTRFAPGGLLHTGQGKWYPGEQLPRWALSLFWRVDGVPVWRERGLIATDTGKAGVDVELAQRFALALTKRLQLDPATLLTGYEDALYYLWRERTLPVNVSVLDAKLEDAQERARLARVFTQGLNRAVGVALPLTGARGQIVGGLWPVRPERLFLLPGDSPMGYRLPLDSLPFIGREQRHSELPADPLAPRPILPQIPGVAAVSKPGPALASDGVVRSALCVEPRDGKLGIFLPPMPDLESFLALIIAVEDVAKGLGQPVQIEGYTPPFDPRLIRMAVTPDPGVIEVNIQPAATWDEAVAITEGVYADATASRLRAEKFQMDGRHTGTGGGNHVVLGAAKPSDSPFLRRPDLLASMIAYWNNHPALSYLFSSLFIGPTSQAPRVDEARSDSVREVELALETLARTQGRQAPWVVDRVLRNLLTDLTGNTHRAEFCIDKLYSPDSATGRLGLLELRGFEMPAHAQMSCVQQLLVRALVSRFWRTPYTVSPVRWGTAIHDRWMLPEVLIDDLGEVLADLGHQGITIDPNWFTVHQEFRFPLISRFNARGVTVELRTALEPWHVLGEDTVAGSTARYVDSSLERIQVLIDGAVDPRHQVTVNGYALPLHPTHVQGRMVAGVRFRAWQPPSCLHPTIGVHHPLVVDLVDTWNDAAIAGCTYHVSHPGGRGSETLPINVREAESRRQARVELRGHTPGKVIAPVATFDGEHPYTLDLRSVAG